MQLTAKKRTITGHKVKNLRSKGIIPATVYGKKISSENLEIDLKDFLKVYKTAGDTKLIDLKLESGKTIPVLIHQVQRHPVNDHILNIDFLGVDLKEMIRVKVPVVAVGESPAVVEKVGALLNPIREIEIECLPKDLPEKIEVNISTLAKLNDDIKVSAIKLGDKIKVLTDVNLTVFTINELVQKEKIEEVVVPTEVEATAQKKEGEEEGEGEEETKEGSKKEEKAASTKATAAKADEPKKEEKK